MASSGSAFARDPSSFGIEIEFIPNTEDPARVYRAMTGLIDASQVIDSQLSAAFGSGVRSVLVLENIEAGSITTWLRSMVDTVDDDALKSGDYKKLIGVYLSKGKGRLIQFLDTRETIRSGQEIYDLQAVIREAATETGIPLSQDPAVPAREIAESLKLISDATGPLHPDDRANYLSEEGSSPINTSFRVTGDSIEELLTQERIVNQAEMILKVKRPDFLGDSMWDFRYEGKKLQAKLVDVEWLQSFRKGGVPLRPGDALRGVVEVETRYGRDGEVIATHHRILKVGQILH